MTQTAPLLSAY